MQINKYLKERNIEGKFVSPSRSATLFENVWQRYPVEDFSRNYKKSCFAKPI